nr:cellulase B5-3 [synthetic construct]
MGSEHHHHHHEMKYKFFTRVPLLSALVLLATACQNLDHTDSDASRLQDNALTLHWNNTWSSSLAVDDGNGSADLSTLLATEGGLVLDMQVEELARGDLKLVLHCGDDCRRLVDISTGARELEGGDWQRVSVPLSCFARPGDQLDSITDPFIAEGAGTGRVRFADIRFEKGSENTFGCLPPEQLPVSPAPLTANWALDWWMPRHQSSASSRRDVRSGTDRRLYYPRLGRCWQKCMATAFL